MVSIDGLDERARAILRVNDRGRYTVPSHGIYPHQWNWDSVFAAWGFSTFDIDRAWVEIETLFSAQWPNGMVPHIIFHQRDDGYFPGPDVWNSGTVPPTGSISQPPIAATFIRKIYETDPGFGRPRLEALFSRLLRWHEWFHKHRNADGLIAATHPWESGRDNSPDWDCALSNIDGSGVGGYTRRDTLHVAPEMRPRKEDYDRYLAILTAGRESGWNEDWIREHGPFRVVDPGLTFILLRAHRDLVALAHALGQPGDRIETWIEEMEAALPNMWNPDAACYCARDLRSGRFARGIASSAFLCWYAGSGDGRMLAALQRIQRRACRGVPSFDPDHEAFEGLRYWRGSTWPTLNALISMGLAEAGHVSLAEAIRSDTCALIREGGFCEYFDPVSGTPAGGRDFSWTAAVWLCWASPSATGRRG